MDSFEYLNSFIVMNYHYAASSKEFEILSDKYTLDFYACKPSENGLYVVSWLIFEAEIPQGSLVIEGDDDDIVSSEIIINPYFYKPIKFLGHIYYRKIKYSEERIKPFNY